MKFLDRQGEWQRLDALIQRQASGLVALWGRRRVGKTRMLTEWCRRHDGLYSVADQSSATVQRRYFAEVIGTRVPGFAETEYADWKSLLKRLSREARSMGWHGPLVVDEFPYWVMSDGTLPSILQNWVDEEARAKGILIVIAGSSQRMMQGMLLDASAPLYGRAMELMGMSPIPAGRVGEALGIRDPVKQVEAYALWGGIPRYWELAEPFGSDFDAAVDGLVLDPMGPLHREPDRLLLEEMPPAVSLRPLLDVIGGGAHRLTEIAGRLAQPATALARPLGRLMDLGLVIRETPYGESEKSSRRSLYRIADPFFQFWFRVVAPRRAIFAQAPREVRLALWTQHKTQLCAAVWEQLCRQAVGENPERLKGLLAKDDMWHPASRWWQGSQPEWDVVSTSLSGVVTLAGEAKWHAKPLSKKQLNLFARALLARPLPQGLPKQSRPILFVPRVEDSDCIADTGVGLMDAGDVMSCLR
jgi:AAA+ ATPase superfamily predicted ATPase